MLKRISLINTQTYANMRKFLIKNGESLWLKNFEYPDQAETFAVNFCDHSKNISVMEIPSGYNLMLIKKGAEDADS